MLVHIPDEIVTNRLQATLASGGFRLEVNRAEGPNTHGSGRVTKIGPDARRISPLLSVSLAALHCIADGLGYRMETLPEHDEETGVYRATLVDLQTGRQYEHTCREIKHVREDARYPEGRLHVGA